MLIEIKLPELSDKTIETIDNLELTVEETLSLILILTTTVLTTCPPMVKQPFLNKLIEEIKTI